MVTVGVRELKQQASELLRMVREDGKSVQITYRGKVVALLVAVDNAGHEDQEARAWADIDQLAAEIAARWPAGVSAVEAVAEGRR